MIMENGMQDFGDKKSGFDLDQIAAEMFTKNLFVDFDDNILNFDASSTAEITRTTDTTTSSFDNTESTVNSMKLEKFDQENYLDLSVLSSAADLNASSSTSPDVAALDSPEDSEGFSDIVLSYISQMLMEEDLEGKFDAYPGDPAMVSSFSDILGDNFSLPPDQSSLYYDQNLGIVNDGRGSSDANLLLDGNSWPYDPLEYQQLQMNPDNFDYNIDSKTLSSVNNNVSNFLDGFDTLSVSELLMQSQPALQFQRGVEEAQKFLPSNDKLVIDLEANGFYVNPDVNEDVKLVANVKTEQNVDGDHYSGAYPVSEPRGRKNRHNDDLDVLEGRNNKQSAVSTEEPTDSKMFDDILLCNEGTYASRIDELRIQLQNEASRRSQSSLPRGSGGGKGSRGKKQPMKEVVDLRTMLIHCAQSIATDDRRSANETLNQIRQHSDPHGDANQRLAHCFADGLQARLAGTGSQIYHSLVSKRIAVVDILKAYQLYMAACPFKKVSYFFSSQTILDVAENATRVHIIDFGIYYGFQWPCFMQKLSNRPGGPPRLKITGVDNPIPGFRPTELIDETGRRLANYAAKFGIPFEYKGIAAKWETITVEDLNIDQDELLIVNCIFRLKNLLDETVIVDNNPRDMVLNLIRKLNPAVFIHAIVNGSYSAPFFVTRFREVLFYYSSLFDMIETNVPREDESRQLIERIIFGRDALNVIACEGSERIERPETYKQMQVRVTRAGFTQLPLKKDIMKKVKSKLKACYHKDFVVDEDNKWLLQGWKGRILYASSTWKPNILS